MCLVSMLQIKIESKNKNKKVNLCAFLPFIKVTFYKYSDIFLA